MRRMTPEENVETVRRALLSLAAGDIEASLVDVDPEVVVDDFDIELDTDGFRGHDGYVRWLSVWNEAWESWRIEGFDFVSVGEDHVLATFTMFVTGKGSGIELDRADAVTYRLRDGKIVGIAYYNDQQQARDAVGLRG